MFEAVVASTTYNMNNEITVCNKTNLNNTLCGFLQVLAEVYIEVKSADFGTCLIQKLNIQWLGCRDQGYRKRMLINLEFNKVLIRARIYSTSSFFISTS